MSSAPIHEFSTESALSLRQEQVQVFNHWHGEFARFLSNNPAAPQLIDLENATRTTLLNPDSRLVSVISVQYMEGAEQQTLTVTNANILALAHTRLQILMANPNPLAGVKDQQSAFHVSNEGKGGPKFISELDYNADLLAMEAQYEAGFKQLSKTDADILLKLVGEIVYQRYFEPLNANILEEDVEVLEREMGEKLSFFNDPKSGEQVARKESIVFANGPSGSGKGLAIHNAKLKTIETGTNGILGQEGEEGIPYLRWNLLTKVFDISRGINKMFPDKLMRLYTAAEIIKAREHLDSEERFHESPAVVGFPRSPDQAISLVRFIADKSTVKSVAFNMSPVVAGNRNMQRVAERLAHGCQPRADDRSSTKGEYIEALESYMQTNNLLDQSARRIKYGYIVEQIYREYLDDPEADEAIIDAAIEVQIAYQIVQDFRAEPSNDISPETSFLSPGARYHKDFERQLNVIAGLRSPKVGEPIETIEINVDTLTPGEQAAALLHALGRDPLRPAI